MLTGGVLFQNDLEYDPVLYSRDRGELDSDARSISSTNMLHNPAPSTDKEDYFTSHLRGPSAPLGYDAYLARGPMPSQIELTRLDYNRTTDDVPLLAVESSSGSISRAYTPTIDSPSLGPGESVNLAGRGVLRTQY
jgi:hypothetical protein